MIPEITGLKKLKNIFSLKLVLFEKVYIPLHPLLVRVGKKNGYKGVPEGRFRKFFEWMRIIDSKPLFRLR